MPSVDIVGVGVWSPLFADWQAFCHGLQSNDWQSEVELKPALIPPRERRRAPQLVKMAVEVMGQACDMASMSPKTVATVFSSAMGDMQITDYMCKALAQSPRLISPTRFHNSVHNAAPGYWSIATESFSPGNAISAYEYTPTMAFLEAAIQVVEEDCPVLVVTQEVSAPETLMDICPATQPFSAALLLAPRGQSEKTIATLSFAVRSEQSDWPALPISLAPAFASNMSAKLLPLLALLQDTSGEAKGQQLSMPVSKHQSIELILGSIA